MLLCLVCLFDLALLLSFFLLSSHLKTCMYMYISTILRSRCTETDSDFHKLRYCFSPNHRAVGPSPARWPRAPGRGWYCSDRSPLPSSRRRSTRWRQRRCRGTSARRCSPPTLPDTLCLLLLGHTQRISWKLLL